MPAKFQGDFEIRIIGMLAERITGFYEQVQTQFQNVINEMQGFRHFIPGVVKPDPEDSVRQLMKPMITQFPTQVCAPGCENGQDLAAWRANKGAPQMRSFALNVVNGELQKFLRVD